MKTPEEQVVEPIEMPEQQLDKELKDNFIKEINRSLFDRLVAGKSNDLLHPMVLDKVNHNDYPQHFEFKNDCLHIKNVTTYQAYNNSWDSIGFQLCNQDPQTGVPVILKHGDLFTISQGDWEWHNLFLFDLENRIVTN